MSDSPRTANAHLHHTALSTLSRTRWLCATTLMVLSAMIAAQIASIAVVLEPQLSSRSQWLLTIDGSPNELAIYVIAALLLVFACRTLTRWAAVGRARAIAKLQQVSAQNARESAFRGVVSARPVSPEALMAAHARHASSRLALRTAAALAIAALGVLAMSIPRTSAPSFMMTWAEHVSHLAQGLVLSLLAFLLVATAWPTRARLLGDEARDQHAQIR
ncbi:MAG: hypothetical protein Q8Q09_09925 [Deltaproteobacteria bacterium]|nr:hypothetical protein [Deltaproteobacteria bacterium]